MLCKSCENWKAKTETNEFVKMLSKGKNHTLACFNVHCENVIDPFDGIKKIHKDCQPNNCVKNQPERLNPETL